jgi:hypothetical protein
MWHLFSNLKAPPSIISLKEIKHTSLQTVLFIKLETNHAMHLSDVDNHGNIKKIVGITVAVIIIIGLITCGSICMIKNRPGKLTYIFYHLT